MDINSLIKQSKFSSANHKAYVNLMYTYYFFNSKHCALLKEKEILPQHYNILKIIKGKHPEPVTPSHILDVMLDKTRDITRLVDKLEKLGYVSRSQKLSNKRFIEISMTDLGLEKIKELEDVVTNHLTHKLSEEESELLSSLLDKMR
ncbi:MAG: hypothetical protein RLZZ546_3262 [Bacteroidota bacterium]|jgi:DNA-binding MarR family transcriptional regulator